MDESVSSNNIGGSYGCTLKLDIDVSIAATALAFHILYGNDWPKEFAVLVPWVPVANDAFNE